MFHRAFAITILTLALSLQLFVNSARADERGPVLGVWEIDDDDNPHYGLLTIAVGVWLKAYPELVPGTPLYFAGAEGSKHSLNPHGRAGTLGMWPDGAIGAHLKIYNRKVSYKVRRAGDPNVMIGEYKAQIGANRYKTGKSTWRRQPPAQIKEVYYRVWSTNPDVVNKTRDQIPYRSRPIKVALTHPVGGKKVYIGVLGERFAGGHDIRLPIRSGISSRSAEKYWICHNGVLISNSEWLACGSDHPLSKDIVGLEILLDFANDVTPGLKAIWIDGQPVFFELAIDGYPGKPELEDPLAALAKEIAQAGDPNVAGPKKHPFTADKVEIDSLVSTLRANYDLSAEAWKNLVDEFFYATKEQNFHNWQGFEAYIDDRAISRERRASVERVNAGLRKLFLVSDIAIEKIRDRYEFERSALRNFDRTYRDDYLHYAFNQLLNRGENFAGMLSEEARIQIAKLRLADPEDEDMPTIRPWKPGDKKWGCSYAEVLDRMMKADPRFRMTYGMYMSQMVTVSGAPVGPTGAGIAHKRKLLHNGVLLAVEQCKKSNH